MKVAALLLPIVLGAIYYLVGASEEIRPAEAEALAAGASTTMPPPLIAITVCCGKYPCAHGCAIIAG